MHEMKDSGIEWIGEIPESKNVIRNKYMFTYEKGKLPNSTNLENRGFPYIGASDLDSLSDDYSTYTDDETLPNAEYDDLLVLWDGARAGLCGTHKIGKVSSTIVRIRGNYTVFQPFLYWYYKGFENFMYQSVNGTTIPHMNKKYIEQIGFIDWTLEEQHRISTYLDTKCEKIDSIIARQQEVIEKLKAYKLSVITEAVTKGLNPDVRMKESEIRFVDSFPEQWENRKMLSILSMRVVDGPHESPELIDEGIPYISATAIENGKINFELMRGYISEEYCNLCDLRYKPQKNDILVIKLGASTGQVAMVETDERFNIWVPLAAVRCNEQAVPRFVYYAFQSDYFIKQMELSWTFGTQQTLGVKTIERLRIIVPNVDEQQQIADYLDKKCSAIDSAIAKKQAIIEKLTAYKKSLIYEVVTGKREVKGSDNLTDGVYAVFISPDVKSYAESLLFHKIINMAGKNLKGRTHLMKIFHAVEIVIGFDFGTQYIRHTHGPYSDKIESLEKDLIDKGWLTVKKSNRIEYSILDSSAYETDYNKYFNNYDSDIRNIVNCFLTMKRTSRAEKFATLLASWNDFIIDGVEPTDEMIINDVRTNWTENKANTDKETWQEILKQIKKANIIPRGYGKHTIRKDN